MEEILRLVFSDPEAVNKIITELGPKALDNAKHIVISGIETTGQVLECLVKDGKIVEHSAKTVQEAVKSTENVAISIVETGGKVCEYLIKDGEIVRHTAETVQLGVKTAGDVAKELIDKGTDTAQVGVKTTGDVAKELIDRGTDTINTAIETVSEVSSQMFDYKAIKQAEKTKRNQQDNQTAQEKARIAGQVIETHEGEKTLRNQQDNQTTQEKAKIAGRMFEDYEEGKTVRNQQDNQTKQKAIEIMGLKILVDGQEKTIEWDSLVEMCQTAINTGNPEIGVQMLSQKYSFETEKEEMKSARSLKALEEFKNILGQVGDIALSMKLGGGIFVLGKEALKTGGKFVDSALSKKKKSKSEEADYKKAYELISNMSEHPELKPMKKLLDRAVKNGSPEVITMTIQVIQEEINDMQNIDL